MKTIQTSSTDTVTFSPLAPITLKPPPIERHKSLGEDDFSNKPVVKKDNTTAIAVTVYSVADLQIGTDSFNIDNLVGEGLFGRVYKAQFSDGKVSFASNQIFVLSFLNKLLICSLKHTFFLTFHK